MGKVIKKFSVILFILLLLVNNSMLTLISKATEEIKNNIDQAQANVIADIELEKYVNYKLNDNEKGLMIQANLKLGIEYQENQEYKPIEATGAIVNLPKINGEYPKDVSVIGISTKATNGVNNAENYQATYEKDSGILKIAAFNNRDDNGNVYSENVDNARDEYRIIAYYSENVYESENTSKEINFSGKAQMKIYDDISSKFVNDFNKNYDVTENISGLISTRVDTNDIYNGFIKSNKLNGTSYRTEYNENLNIDINYKNLADEIRIKANNENSQTVYKGIVVNKQEILDELGEEGILKVLNTNGDVLLQVDKNTESKEDGTIELNYENENSEIVILLSRPEKLGTLNIFNKRQIKNDILDINEISTKYNIEAVNYVEEINEQTQEVEIKQNKVYEYMSKNTVNIKDAETRIDFNVDNINWTNEVQNQVNFTATLVSNEARYDLFKNPVIEIKLPEDVDKVILGDTSLLYNNSNFIQNTEVIDNGINKIIRITLEGTQNEYFIDSIYEGTHIVIPAKITLKSELTTNNSNIEFRYLNENSEVIDYKVAGTENKLINIKETDGKQDNRLSLARYKIGNVNLQNDINEEEKINGIEFSTVAQVGNKILEDNDVVYEDQIITYKVKITNNSTVDLKNLNIVGKIPENTTYVTVSNGIDDIENMEKMYEYIEDAEVKEKVITIENLPKGKTIERVYEVKVNKLQENAEQVNIISDTALYNNSRKVGEFTLNNIVNKSNIYARMVSTMGGFENEDNQWEYYVLVTNNTNKELKDVDVSVNIPRWMSIYETGSLTPDVEVSNESDNDGFYKATISQLPVGTEVVLRVYMEPKNLDKNVYIYNLEVAAEINAEGMPTYNTNLNMQTMFTREINVTMSSESEGKEVKYDDEVEYNVNIKVNGNSQKFKDIDINVLDYLPEGLLPEEVEYEKFEYNEETQNYEWSKVTEDISSKILEDDEEEGTSPDVRLYITIPNNAEINIKIKARVDLIPENREVSNSVSVITGEADTIISNIVKFTIKAGTSEGDIPVGPIEPGPGDDNKDDNDDNDGNDNKNTYEISGQVWLDENKDGQKGEEEEKISGVTVKLFDTTTNAIVTTKKGEKYITTTDNKGNYKFSNLEKGKYLVIFEYDTNTYELTYYQKNGISESLNSDVIKKEISIDGNKKTAGVTDVITIDSKNKDNIDVGLVRGATLDLKLDKYVSNIEVTNSKGTKNYEYKDQKLAKVEVASKEIANTTITITYKLVVTNEGDQAAYISEITDYLPEGLNFDSVEGNWEMLNDGSIKIYALSGVLLKPKMSKEIEITAVATDVGRFVNEAEITLTKNDINAKDIDSIEGNRNKEEDDYSQATVIVSVKTGAIIGTGIGILLVIALVILFIALKNNKIKFKKFNKISLLIIMSSIVVTSVITTGITYSQAKTVAEKKAELKEKYTTSETININSGSSHFYTHDTPQSKVINSGRLHCTNGSKSMCGSGSHYYKQTSVKITKFDVKTTKSTANKYEADPKKAEGKKLDSTHEIYGPYKIKRTNENKIVEDKIKSMILYNTDGNKISSSKWEICDKSGNEKEFEYNKEFYIKIDKGINAANMKIKIESAGTTSYKAEWKVVEQWRCYKTSGGQHHTSTGRPVSCGNTSSAQPLERVWTGKTEWVDKKPASTTITLYLKGKSTETEDPEPSEGGAQIQKLDDREQIPLQGVGFSFITTIKSYDWYASEDVYHDVDRGHYNYWTSTYTDEKGIQHTYGGSTWISNWVTEYWYTKNYYHWVEHTVYLGNDREWGYSEGIFYTDEDGIASGSGTLSLNTQAINDGALGNDHTVYAEFVGNTIIATEKSYPTTYYGYDRNIGRTWSIIRDGGTTIKADNHQYEVMLSGFVWLDTESGKLSMTNSEFNGEEGINGITVKLKDINGNTLQTTSTSELGIYSEIEGGEYRFYNVNLDELEKENYRVEFEYCGIDYQSVIPDLDTYEGSKAIDDTARAILDNKFSSVDGNGSQNLNVNGVSLYYNPNSQYESKIREHSGCAVYASTEEAGYNLYDGFVPTAREIRYVNLGLFKKAQTDYALAEDIYNVRVGVNGFQHVYRYGSLRYQSDGEDTNEESSWNVGVKFQNNRGSYTRAIYKADYEYENPQDRSKEISVYVTYKISLRNEGTYLGRINNIIDYCDSNYTLVNAGYSINNEDTVSDSISFREVSSPNSGYKKYLIDTSSKIINEGEEQHLYIQFRMDRQAVLTILNNGETKHNLVEINSYTTFNEDTGRTVAVYDIDSVPGNAVVENFNTYEDDTDSARSLQLTIANPRAVEGTVFVDSTGKDSNIYEGKERIGNGIFDNGEKTLAGVKVTMAEVDEQGIPKQNGLEYTVKTDQNGNFKIDNFVAGYYQITYTWGDNEYMVQYYKGTIYNKERTEKTQTDPYWYRGSEYENDTKRVNDRLTDAMDNYKEREEIDNQMERITKNTLEQQILNAYEEGDNSQGEKITITKMNSTTPTIAFSVEYDTDITDGNDNEVKFIVKNIDFGIVERPKQQLNLYKRVSGYKITLANGQILVDTTISEKGEFEKTHPYTIIAINEDNVVNNLIARGLLKTEMDNELIEGAVLEAIYTIKVRNVGELDYTSPDYYFFGIADDTKKVKSSVEQLLDYVDGRLSVVDDKWKDTQKDYVEEYNTIKKNNSEYLNKVKTYVTENLAKPLAPGEESKVELHTSKLLTSTGDNQYNNQSEITEVKKTDGFSTGTPVKMIWETGKYFNVASSETITIIPSTGENRNYALPTIIGVIAITILGAGVVIIKKFVIK